jgi:hypothetical protein
MSLYGHCSFIAFHAMSAGLTDRQTDGSCSIAILILTCFHRSVALKTIEKHVEYVGFFFIILQSLFVSFLLFMFLIIKYIAVLQASVSFKFK